MNAGAYGRDWSDVLVDVTVIDADGSRTLTPDELGLSYRHSDLRSGEVVAHARFALEPRPAGEVKFRVAELLAQRKATQPTNRRTFGSVFKNPAHELGAGRMLEECGLKGHRIGGARISPRARELHRERGWRNLRRRDRAHGRGPQPGARPVRSRPRARGAIPGPTPVVGVVRSVAKGGRCLLPRARQRVRLRLPARAQSTTHGRLPALGQLIPSGRSILVGLMLVVLAAGAYAAALETSIFAVRTLDVRGGTPQLRAEVRQALEGELGRSLLRVDGADVEQRLASLPGISALKYNRAFPNTLDITVRAERPVLVLRRGPDAFLVSATGRVLRTLVHPHLSSLPRVWLPSHTQVTVNAKLPRRTIGAGRAVARWRRSAASSSPRRSQMVTGGRWPDARPRVGLPGAARRCRRHPAEARDRPPRRPRRGCRGDHRGLPRRQRPRSPRAEPQLSSHRLSFRVRQVENTPISVDNVANCPYPPTKRRRSTAPECSRTLHPRLRLGQSDV